MQGWSLYCVRRWFIRGEYDTIPNDLASSSCKLLTSTLSYLPGEEGVSLLFFLHLHPTFLISRESVCYARVRFHKKSDQARDFRCLKDHRHFRLTLLDLKLKHHLSIILLAKCHRRRIRHLHIGLTLHFSQIIIVQILGHLQDSRVNTTQNMLYKPFSSSL